MLPKPTKSAPPRLLPNGRIDRSARDDDPDGKVAKSLAALAGALPAFARRQAQ